ncbi:MAG: diguanylate cyclase, partial [Lachnospiraceae bacterium]|nr:diguanylate cyclase [Lachnospiraceae bacterium]
AGDIPNIQADGYRTASTLGIPVTDGLTIRFHSMSLPTARLVWHCAYVDLFYSADKMPGGDDYREYALIRLDGENWEAENVADNKLLVNIGDDFDGWDAWKEANKKGYDCTIRFRRQDNVITTTTENQGISIRNVTTILDSPEEVYASLTGDQCALTNIRLSVEGDS